MVTVLSSVFALVHRRAHRDRHRDLPDQLRPAPGGQTIRARWSTCSPRCPRSSSACGASSSSPRGWRRSREFLNDNLGWFFLFADGNVSLAGGGTIFTAGIVLAVMILPIITSVTREVFSLTPAGHIEAAQALGATKWEVVRMTVFPYGRSGMIAASMLGLGRALGETVAVLIILRTAAQAGHWSLFDGGYTFASKIASAAAEFSSPLPTGAYIAAGFVLFVLTFIVNALARASSRRKGERTDDTTTLDSPASRHRPSSRSAARAS